VKRICAWCLVDMGEIAPEQPGVTHGICEKCKATILAEKDGHNPTFLDGMVIFPPCSHPILSKELRNS